MDKNPTRRGVLAGAVAAATAVAMWPLTRGGDVSAATSTGLREPGLPAPTPASRMDLTRKDVLVALWRAYEINRHTIANNTSMTMSGPRIKIRCHPELEDILRDDLGWGFAIYPSGYRNRELHINGHRSLFGSFSALNDVGPWCEGDTNTRVAGDLRFFDDELDLERCYHAPDISFDLPAGSDAYGVPKDCVRFVFETSADILHEHGNWGQYSTITVETDVMFDGCRFEDRAFPDGKGGWIQEKGSLASLYTLKAPTIEHIEHDEAWITPMGRRQGKTLTAQSILLSRYPPAPEPSVVGRVSRFFRRKFRRYAPWVRS